MDPQHMSGPNPDEFQRYWHLSQNTPPAIVQKAEDILREQNSVHGQASSYYKDVRQDQRRKDTQDDIRRGTMYPGPGNSSMF